MAPATLANIVTPVVEKLQFPHQYPVATIVVQPTTADMSKWVNPMKFSLECSSVHHHKATELVLQPWNLFDPSHNLAETRLSCTALRVVIL